MDEYTELGKEAAGRLEQHDYAGAGDYFTFAGLSAIGASKFTEMEVESGFGRLPLGGGVTDMLAAVVCYRLAGDDERTTRRSKEGILLVEDIRDGFFADPVQNGLAHELTGDFRLFGNLGGAVEAYSQAVPAYEACDNPIGWAGEPEFDLPLILGGRIARTVGTSLDSSLFGSLTARIEFKQTEFPALFEKLLDVGHLDYRSEK